MTAEQEPAGSSIPTRSIGRWADPAKAAPLSSRMREYLSEHVGSALPWPAVEPRLPDVASISLPADFIDRLVSIVGAANVYVEPMDRLRASGGASYVDLIKRRSGDVGGIPDVIVAPRSHDETLAVIQACSEARVAVVPTGGGTSVVGGLATDLPRIALMTFRMRDLVSVDQESHIVRVQAGITGPMLEALLAARGLTLGHTPQSWEQASIGGYVATRSAGQASTGYGRSDDMVESVRLAAPAGEWRVGHSPASAAGPDLLGVIIGSEGALGVITEVDLRVRTLPGAHSYEGLMLPSFEAGIEMFRALTQSGHTADVMRLSDEQETQTSLLMSAPSGLAGRALDVYLRRRGIDPERGALVIFGWEDIDQRTINARRSAAWKVMRRSGAVSLTGRPGESWRRHRFMGPYLRDSLIDAGYLVETLETSTRWSGLTSLRDSIHTALTESLATKSTTPYVMTHVSHVYETGASLYTTVIAVADRDDPYRQWREAKSSVSNAIVEHGGTITHHHAVGRDHAPWLADEVGVIGIGVLQAIKDVCDPHGICNPGVLSLA
jgi:alkyldihydroxyacetonephosphate synthase